MRQEPTASGPFRSFPVDVPAFTPEIRAAITAALAYPAGTNSSLLDVWSGDVPLLVIHSGGARAEVDVRVSAADAAVLVMVTVPGEALAGLLGADTDLGAHLSAEAYALISRLAGLRDVTVQSVAVSYLPDGDGFGHEHAGQLTFVAGGETFTAVLDLRDPGVDEVLGGARGMLHRSYGWGTPQVFSDGVDVWVRHEASEVLGVAAFVRVPFGALQAAVPLMRDALDLGDARVFTLRADRDWVPDASPEASALSWLPHGFGALAVGASGVEVLDRCAQAGLAGQEDLTGPF